METRNKIFLVIRVTKDACVVTGYWTSNTAGHVKLFVHNCALMNAWQLIFDLCLLYCINVTSSFGLLNSIAHEAPCVCVFVYAQHIDIITHKSFDVTFPRAE